jgi:hypothetical protein
VDADVMAKGSSRLTDSRGDTRLEK